MVRIGIIAIGLCLTSCLGTRTEFGRKRTLNFGRPGDDVNRIVYTLVDTAKLYEKISKPGNDPFPIRNKIYLKFYANGRVGKFLNCDLNDINSLNPKKADMGYYEYDKGEFFIKTFFEHPQGGGWLKEKLVKSTPDTLCFEVDKSMRKYKMMDLPKEFLIFKPDW